MSSAPKYIPHYTLADYRGWEGEWELWNGVPVAMTPSPFGRHQLIAANLVAELRSGLQRSGCEDRFVLFETDWEIAEDTVVRPDVAVLCGEVPERYIDRPPALVAEITSESTRHKDATAKRELYAQQGVGTYLRIDPAGHAVEIDRLTKTGQYTSAETADPLPLSIDDDCQISLELENIFHPS